MSFNLESSNERVAVVIEFLKAANNGMNVLDDNHKNILKLLCEKKKFVEVEKGDYKELYISHNYSRQLAIHIYREIKKALEKKGSDIKNVDQSTFLTVVDECRRLLCADSVTTTAEQNGNSARKAAKQNGTSEDRAIVVLSGRLTEDVKKIELNGLSRVIKEITANLETRYLLKADPRIDRIKTNSVRVTLKGLPENLEKLKESFRAKELEKVFDISIKDIKLLNGTLDDENTKNKLVEEIFSKPLGYRKLVGINLSETDLHDAFLVGAILNKANLSYADLSEAELYRASLIQADLFRAKLCGASLIQADLREADLREADLSDTNWWASARIDDTTKLSNFWREILDFFKRKAEGIDPPSGTNGSGADFTSADLTGAKFIYVDCKNAIFNNANFNGATVRGVNFNGAKLQVSNATGAKFRANKGLSKPTRRYLKQQGAIFEIHPAWRIVGQVAAMMWNIAIVVVGVSFYFCSFVFQLIKKILPYLAIAIVAGMVFANWNYIELTIESIESTLQHIGHTITSPKFWEQLGKGFQENFPQWIPSRGKGTPVPFPIPRRG
ncbi:hypothetical protein C7B80_02875 [Cyanosarcina cf. burmensis CCALA 770]|nr:hypothetical protein C7B80_02875 [Cyanosarcina cf. burmensis CCALA 770]